jgi:hypothetical protein
VGCIDQSMNAVRKRNAYCTTSFRLPSTCRGGLAVHARVDSPDSFLSDTGALADVLQTLQRSTV